MLFWRGSGRAIKGLQASRVVAERGERGDQRQHLQERRRGGSAQGRYYLLCTIVYYMVLSCTIV